MPHGSAISNSQASFSATPAIESVINDEATVEVDSSNGETASSSSALSEPEDGSKIGFNFFVMNWHQILMRTGWIFKTESLVMPAVLDSLGGSAWLRGLLPMLNRLGQSVPPLMAANTIRRSPFKKWRLVSTSVTMGVVFCSLAMLWSFKESFSTTAIIAAILVLYAIFFSCLGVNQLILSALIGKLIPVVQRGRLMQFSSVLGSVIAIGCAWVLLKRWLISENPHFSWIFMFAGVLFIAAGALAVLFREPRDVAPSSDGSLRGQLRESLVLLRTDRNLGLMLLSATMFGMMMTLFPHYQALARTRLELGFDSLVPWIIAQNLGVALFSLPAGWMADRRGNRVVLLVLMGGLAIVPLLSLALASSTAYGPTWFIVVFGMLGLTPVTIRTFNNYTLELTGREMHPRYLSLLSLFMAGPAVLGSLAIGAMIDKFGFELAFWLVSGMQFVGFGTCFLLAEPRKSQKLVDAAPTDCG
ncbi:MAG: MFS transporter [Pirellulaceae bacterium]|nr:MFS transporter [Pirellulaceae bacterium]